METDKNQKSEKFALLMLKLALNITPSPQAYPVLGLAGGFGEQVHPITAVTHIELCKEPPCTPAKPCMQLSLDAVMNEFTFTWWSTCTVTHT